MYKFLTVLMQGMMLSVSSCEKKGERVLPKTGSSDQIDATEQSRLERGAFISNAQNEPKNRS